jgi:very-short-patch-repair endonuclease
MRHHPTDSEELLWQYLRAKRLLGVQFRRQVPLHGFIVDFYASSIKLAAEVDGGWHNEREHLDAARDRKLRAKGVRVVRVSAEEVGCAMSAVLIQLAIAIEVKQRAIVKAQLSAVTKRDGAN